MIFSLKRLVGIASVFLGLIMIISGGFYWYEITSPNTPTDAVAEFIIYPGQGSTVISNRLKVDGLIRSPRSFQLYTWIHGISSRLLPGTYQIPRNLTIPQVATMLYSGEAVSKERTLTFIEGWSNQEIASYLEQQHVVTAVDFFAAVQKKADWWDSYPVLATRPRDRDLEGYLFPDTYRVFKDATAQDIVKKMLDNLEQKITPDVRYEITRQGKTIHQILTLASIIEKEVSRDDDRKLVADIFYKRIAAGIGLQSDATVNYVTGKGTTRPSLDDLKQDTPYNTYTHRGLPPGPICNPSLSSIMATMYPTANPYYYFLTTPDGTVIYSKTHVEHVAAKAKYYP